MKNKKIAIVLVLAVLFSVLACVSIYAFLSPERTTIYLFRDNYAAGTKITEDMFIPMQVDANIVVAGNKTDASLRFVTSLDFEALLARNDSLRVNVGEGTPLMLTYLTATGGNKIEMTMDPTSVAVTVSVDNITAVTGDITANSYVNVYYTSREGATMLILENMRVLQIHKENGKIIGATLEVTNEEAKILISAENTGLLHLGLINHGGYINEER